MKVNPDALACALLHGRSLGAFSDERFHHFAETVAPFARDEIVPLSIDSVSIERVVSLAKQHEAMLSQIWQQHLSFGDDGASEDGAKPGIVIALDHEATAPSDSLDEIAESLTRASFVTDVIRCLPRLVSESSQLILPPRLALEAEFGVDWFESELYDATWEPRWIAQGLAPEAELLLVSRENFFRFAQEAKAKAVVCLVPEGEPLPKLEELTALASGYECFAIAAVQTCDHSEAIRLLLRGIQSGLRFDEALRLAAKARDSHRMLASDVWLRASANRGAAKRYVTSQATRERAASSARQYFANDEDREVQLLARQPDAPAPPSLLGVVEVDASERAVVRPCPEFFAMISPPTIESLADVMTAGAVADDTASGSDEREVSSRWLQTRLFIECDDGSLLRRERSFVANRTHTQKVRVAPKEQGWQVLDGAAMPEPHFEPGDEAHELEVLFNCDCDASSPQKQKIRLPRLGASASASFTFLVPSGQTQVVATILVLHKGRHLQSGTLRGNVVASDSVDDSALTIEFSSEEPAAVDFEHQHPAHLTIGVTGEELVIVPREGKPFKRRIPGLREGLEAIRDALFEAARETAWLDEGLGAGGGLTLLRTLAVHGRILKDAIFGTDTMISEGQVEVIADEAADYFPIEILYDHARVTEDAVLCDCFLSSEKGEPCDTCKATKDGTHLCPSGFWGLRRIIGRHIRGADGVSAGPVPNRETATLPPLTRAILGASAKVNEDDKTRSNATCTAISKTLGSEVEEVCDWKAWSKAVIERNPTLLVLLPHNELTPTRLPALELGKASYLRSDQIDADYVRAGLQPPPVVLLLGCRTASTEIGYGDFVGRFRTAGAAIVVGTVANTLGKLAAPFAELLVKELALPQSETLRVGEALRLARLRAIQTGNVMGLAVTAFGDPDWQLARSISPC